MLIEGSTEELSAMHFGKFEANCSSHKVFL